MLGLLALKMRVGIRKHEDTVTAENNALSPLCVARQAVMSGRIHFSRADTIADFEAGFRVLIGAHKIPPSSRRDRDRGGNEGWR